MNQEFSILQLIINASFVVQIVMGILLVCSIVSWGIIFNKLMYLFKIKMVTVSFCKKFSTTDNISGLYNTVKQKSKAYSTALMFLNGLNEYNKLNQEGIKNQDAILLNLERTLSSTAEDEVSSYEKGLSTLATFGSVSPYIGLFGTVWGIMHAFVGLGTTGQATLAQVAPGIAEALIATAIGLFVAIPAYIFYNIFLADINMLNSKMNRFGDEFLNLINRRIASSKS